MLEPRGLPDLTTALPEWDHQLLKMQRSRRFLDVARNKISVSRPTNRAQAPAVGQGCGLNRSTPFRALFRDPLQTILLFGFVSQTS
jgi:hypothetical protein